MEPPAITELTVRARDVFRLVVEAYIDSGQPVGSRTLSKLATLNLSPASIRNVMQDLEEVGLLTSPHVSAGRIPTEHGLRLFVDGIMQTSEPSAEDRNQIEASVAEPGPIENTLAQATFVLSGLSACAGLVLVPKYERILKQVAFVLLSPGQALVVLVASDGAIENRVIDVPVNLPPSALIEAGNYISRAFARMTLAEVQNHVQREIESERIMIDRTAQDLVNRGLAIWSLDCEASENEQHPMLIVRGQANLLDDSAVEDLDRVRQLLDELEKKQEIVALLDKACKGRATQIFIGSENQLFPLSGSSVIVSPYHGSDGRMVGVVGVIGPTRLNYARIVPMVDFTAQTLSGLMR